METRRYSCLRVIPIFSGTDASTFPLICRASTKKVLRKGDFLFRQGDAADALYFIKAGSLKLCKTTEGGDEVITQIVGPGEAMGESCLFRDNIYLQTSAVALEDAKICCLSRRSFEEVVKNEPKLSFQIIKALGERLDHTLDVITQLTTQTTQERVLGLFLQLAEEHGVPCREGIRIDIRLTQQDIASMVGASRVMVSQVIQGLIQAGYITRSNKAYIVKTGCPFDCRQADG
jgi:CRP/FNR family transcriptional regulator